LKLLIKLTNFDTIIRFASFAFSIFIYYNSILLWMKTLPSYHPTEILIDVSFTKTFDIGLNIVLTVIYFIVLWISAIAVFYKNTKIR